VIDNHSRQAEGIAEQIKATVDKAVDGLRDATDDQQQLPNTSDHARHNLTSGE
jgi:uncharacterized protein YjbJ (UPF0337 family)